MDDQEEIAHLEKLISLRKKSLYNLEEMLASYGADQPLHLLNSLTMVKEELARYAKQLEMLTGASRETENNLHTFPL